MGLLEVSGNSFEAFLESAGQMPFKKVLQADFEHFYGPLAKWLSGGLWRLTLSISGACWPFLVSGCVKTRRVSDPHR